MISLKIRSVAGWWAMKTPVLVDPSSVAILTRSSAARTQASSEVIVTAKAHAASGFVAAVVIAREVPVAIVTPLPWRSTKGAARTGASGDEPARTFRYHCSYGNAPT